MSNDVMHYELSGVAREHQEFNSHVNGNPSHRGHQRDELPGSADHPQVPSLEKLQARCETLLQELNAFATHLKKHELENRVELATFRSDIQSEIKSLKKVSQTAVDSERVGHLLRSRNLPFLEAVWDTAKRSSAVIAFEKRFFAKNPNAARNGEDARQTRRPFGNSALVDVVADDGAEWIKVSLVTEKRLLFDLAKQGWICGSEDDSSGNERPEEIDHDDDKIPILKAVESVMKVSKAARVRYKHPRVHFVLPKISEGHVAEIDGVVNTMRRMGAIVSTAHDAFLTSPMPAIETALFQLMVDDFSAFSHVLNIDCTILLALVTDISHGRIVEEPWFNARNAQWLRHQIENEDRVKLLSSVLYPALGGHSLVCTIEAAKRMREIVDTIGTDTEKERTSILLGDNSADRELLAKAWRNISKYPVPECFAFPLKIVDANDDDAATPLPRLASKVAEQLTAINQSVFFYGWRTGFTTITSNRVVKQIEATIEQNRGPDDEDVVGPKVWLCKTARSLVGREKGRSERRENSSG